MLVILFIACFHVITTNAQQKGDEVCETLPSEIHLIKGTIHHVELNYLWNNWFTTRLICLLFLSLSPSHSPHPRPTSRRVWWIGSSAAYMQRRSAGQQVRRIVQQPSPTVGYHTNRIPKRVLLLPWKLFAWARRHSNTLLRSRRNTTHRTRNGHHGYSPQGTSRVPVLQVRRLFTIISINSQNTHPPSPTSTSNIFRWSWSRAWKFGESKQHIVWHYSVEHLLKN